MKRYRVEVGRVDGVQPGNLVGAIANEGGLDSRQIGPIPYWPVFHNGRPAVGLVQRDLPNAPANLGQGEAIAASSRP